jgi:hypothetical protein
MKKITIKQIIDFRGKGEKAKKNFALGLRQTKPEVKPENGGDYWKISVSAIAKAYKQLDSNVIADKIKETEEKLNAAKYPPVKVQYKRNIEIMRNYENFDFKKWAPPGRYVLLKNHKAVLTIKDLFVETTPHVVFSFGKENEKEVGAIWLVAKKDGFETSEIGMFVDILARYLRIQFGKRFTPNPKYCMAIDLIKNYKISYSQLENREVSYLLNKTIDEIKSLM